jgi:cytochrome c2
MRAWKASLSLAVTIAAAAGLAAQQHAAALDKRRSVAEALAGGDARRGAQIYGASGCGACHALQSRGLPQGAVGPALTGLARRAYIAGRLTNGPDNLARWIADPQAVDPETAMPDVGLSSDQARDIAAYLYWMS